MRDTIKLKLVWNLKMKQMILFIIYSKNYFVKSFLRSFIV